MVMEAGAYFWHLGMGQINISIKNVEVLIHSAKDVLSDPEQNLFTKSIRCLEQDIVVKYSYGFYDGTVMEFGGFFLEQGIWKAKEKAGHDYIQ